MLNSFENKSELQNIFKILKVLSIYCNKFNLNFKQRFQKLKTDIALLNLEIDTCFQKDYKDIRIKICNIKFELMQLIEELAAEIKRQILLFADKYHKDIIISVIPDFYSRIVPTLNQLANRISCNIRFPSKYQEIDSIFDKCVRDINKLKDLYSEISSLEATVKGLQKKEQRKNNKKLANNIIAIYIIPICMLVVAFITLIVTLKGK